MNNYNKHLIVRDNFYDNPDEIRYIALRQGLCNHGYHSGMRTLPCFNHEAHDKITTLLNRPIYPHGDCYVFQFNTATDVSWIHSDAQPSEIITKPNFNFWAAVVYLTPNLVKSWGTTLYTNKTYNSRGLKDTVYNEKRSRGEAIIDFISDESSDI